MCEYGNNDPRSIFNEENRKRTATRTPAEILRSVRQSELRAYWDDPPAEDCNCPMDYFRADGWIRSGNLALFLINDLGLSREASILEIGSGVGRNLAVLRFAGYRNLTGVELSSKSIATMREMMPVLADITIHQGPVEDVLPRIEARFDLVFSMAVLEHLPHESADVFAQICRVTKKYLLTIEDEKCISSRHFPRRYDQVFTKLGLRQIQKSNNLDALPRSFVRRLFVKNEEEKP